MEKQNSLREIRAAEVTLEVTDSQTGLTLRRTLPIDYLETANCLSPPCRGGRPGPPG